MVNRFVHGGCLGKNSASVATADADDSSETLSEFRRRGGRGEGYEDGVVPADRAEDAVDGSAVDGAGHRLRAGGGSADHDQIAGRVCTFDVFSDSLFEPRLDDLARRKGDHRATSKGVAGDI